MIRELYRRLDRRLNRMGMGMAGAMVVGATAAATAIVFFQIIGRLSKRQTRLEQDLDLASLSRYIVRAVDCQRTLDPLGKNTNPATGLAKGCPAPDDGLYLTLRDAKNQPVVKNPVGGVGGYTVRALCRPAPGTITAPPGLDIRVAKILPGKAVSNFSKFEDPAPANTYFLDTFATSDSKNPVLFDFRSARSRLFAAPPPAYQILPTTDATFKTYPPPLSPPWWPPCQDVFSTGTKVECPNCKAFTVVGQTSSNMPRGAVVHFFGRTTCPPGWSNTFGPANAAIGRYLVHGVPGAGYALGATVGARLNNLENRWLPGRHRHRVSKAVSNIVTQIDDNVDERPAVSRLLFGASATDPSPGSPPGQTTAPYQQYLVCEKL